MKLQQLKEKKTKILDEVMEKETYKVAKQILDKFGSNQPSVVRPSVPLGAGLNRQQPTGRAGHVDTSQIRRRQPPLAPPATAATPSSLSTSMVSVSSPAGRVGPPSLGPPQGPSASAPAPPLPQSGRPPVGGLSRTAPGPPLPRPVLPRERGYLDKFVEFLVGDGPANRFALICRQCQSHNGMALREEFEYVAFRCCYCYYWNPARKQRPVAPRLPDAAAAAASISDSSSGSDMSAPPSAIQSRRASVVEVESEDASADSVITDANLVKQALEPAEEGGLSQSEAHLASDIEVINKDEVEEESDIRSEITEEETKTVSSQNEETTETTVGHNHEKDTKDNDHMDIDD